MTPDGTFLMATNLFVCSGATNLPIQQLTNYTGPGDGGYRTPGQASPAWLAREMGRFMQ